MLWMLPLLGTALAEEPESSAPQKWHRHSVAAGVGHHYGILGLQYTYRPVVEFDVAAAVGLGGVALQGRFHPLPWRPLYVAGGMGPIVYSEELGTRYGGDFTAGVELADTAFHLNAGVGAGAAAIPGGLRVNLVLDLGIGFSFVRPGEG